jgi:hypothetical protein
MRKLHVATKDKPNHGMKIGKLLLITWLDHTTFPDNIWRTKKQMNALSPSEMRTVGWLLKETEDYIIVVSTKNCDTYTGEFCIVKSTIRGVQELNE